MTQPEPTPIRDGPGRLVPLAGVHDARGSLAALEFAAMPFTPQRFFAVFDVAGTASRGNHAHRECEQLLICLSGSLSCSLDDGRRRATYRLVSPVVGLYVPRMTWGTQFGHSSDAVLGVFASLSYDRGDYIDDYVDFSRLVAQGSQLGAED